MLRLSTENGGAGGRDRMPITNFLAIDPGDIHQGVAYFEIDISLEVGSTLRRFWTRDLKRDALLRLVEDASIDALVVETFVLYPWMAREQGYSKFPTVKVIGVLEYIAELRGLPIFIQGADVKKKSRRIGERLGFPGSIRMIGSARGKYRGWDYDGPSQHERDATGHGVWWAFEHPASIIRGQHRTGQCRLVDSSGS